MHYCRLRAWNVLPPEDAMLCVVLCDLTTSWFVDVFLETTGRSHCGVVI